jgi:hypothetical protein
MAGKDKQILQNATRHGLAMTDVRTGKPFDGKGPKRKEVLGPYRSKTELLYAQHLEALRLAGKIHRWEYEPDRFDLTIGVVQDASDKRNRSHCYYLPDFWVQVDEWGYEQEYHEAKGFARTADRQRWRTAAGQHPEYVFKWVRRIKGQWVTETFVS